MQRIMNRRVCEQLEKHGDNLNNEREIDHLAFFRTVAAQSEFARHVRQKGFAVRKASSEPNDEGRFPVEFSRADQPAEIDEVVLPLFQKIMELGGDYDGWGCQISPDHKE